MSRYGGSRYDDSSESESDIDIHVRHRTHARPGGSDRRYTDRGAPSYAYRHPYPERRRVEVVMNSELSDSEFSESSDDSTEGNTAKADAKPEWREPKSILPDGSVTDLLCIQSAEYQVDKAGKQRIFLVCPNRPGKDNASRVQMRWLHIHHACPKIETLSKVVMDCSFIPLSLRTVALGILDEVSQNKMYQRDSGHWERNEYSKGHDSSRVVFMSMLHVGLRPRSTRKINPDAAKTLLEFVYYNGVEEDRENEQVVRKMDVGSPSECLHVSTLWCLLLGSGILITFSHLSLAELCGDVIEVDSRGSQPFYTIKVKYRELTRNVIVEPNCSYVDFFRQAVALCTSALNEVADFELRDENYELFAANEWIALMASDTADDKTLFLTGLTWLTRSSRYQMSGTALRSQEVANERGVYDSKTSGMLEWDRRIYSDERSHARRDGAPSPPPSYTDRMLRSGPARDTHTRHIDVEVPSRELVPFSRDLTDTRYRSASRSRTERIVTSRRSYHDRNEQPRRLITSPYEPPEIYIDTGPRRTFPAGEEYGVGRSIPQQSHHNSYPYSRYNYGDGIRVYGGPSMDDGIRVYGSPLEDDYYSQSPPVRTFNTRTIVESVYSSSSGYSEIPGVVKYIEGPGASESLDHGTSHKGPSRKSTQSTDDWVFNHRANSSTGEGRQAEGKGEDKDIGYVEPGSVGTSSVGFNPANAVSIEEGSGSDSIPPTQGAIRGSEGSLPRPRHSTYSSSNSSSNSYVDWDTRATFARGGKWSRHIRFAGQEPDASGAVVETVDVLKLPFFMWRFPGSQNSSTMDTTEEIGKELFRILGKVNKSLTKDELGTLYDRTFKCTMEDLLKRHVELSLHESEGGENSEKEVRGETEKEGEVKDPEPIVDQETKTDHEVAAPGMSAEGGTEDRRPNGLPSRVTFEDGTEVPQRVRPPPMNRKRAQDLFNVSKDILSSFVPIEDNCKIHQVCTRFWGAIDEMLRQLSWASKLGVTGQKWLIRDFGTNEGSSFGDCSACATHTTYTSAAKALEHLHTHLSCPRSTRPNDDPCFAWLKGTDDPRGENSAIALLTEMFVEDLLDVQKLVRQVHSLVATIKKGQQGTAGRPLMPRNLVWAFEELLSAYILAARRSTLNNKLLTCDDPRSRRYWQNRTDLVARRASSKLQRVRSLLEGAKKDILLSGSGRGRLDGTGVDGIGPEFLVAALSGAVQNRPVHGKTDLVQMYDDYLSKLRLQAAQRPQRRIFLDVDKLEEELGALYDIVGKQHGLLRWYLEAISPKPWQRTRSKPMVVETMYTDKQMSQLRDRGNEIDQLESKAGALKDQVKQTLEILDEGHGKTMRVFTIVTLFFLPLTFVSGFMGMNTSDIRNTDSSQTLFWAVAVPVTAMVLGLALIYGYKGNDIEDWVWRTLHLGHSLKTSMTTSTNATSWGVSMDQANRRPRLWPMRKRKKAAMRRPTNDSIF